MKANKIRKRLIELGFAPHNGYMASAQKFNNVSDQERKAWHLWKYTLSYQKYLIVNIYQEEGIAKAGMCGYYFTISSPNQLSSLMKGLGIKPTTHEK